MPKDDRPNNLIEILRRRERLVCEA
jgi:hypothetical protein